jgi:hypothetical protein
MITPLLKQHTYFNEIRTGTDNVRPSNNPRHFMLQKIGIGGKLSIC